jgi:hypothetical protein
MFTKLWSPTKQVLCKKNCFHHFDHLAQISNTVLIWQQPNLLAQPSKVPQASASPCWHSFWQKFISLDNQAPKPNPVFAIPKHPFCEAGHIWTIFKCCSYPAIHKPPMSTKSTSYIIACSQFWHSCQFKKRKKIGAFHLERRESKPEAWVRMNKDIEMKKADDSHPSTNKA